MGSLFSKLNCNKNNDAAITDTRSALSTGITQSVKLLPREEQHVDRASFRLNDDSEQPKIENGKLEQLESTDLNVQQSETTELTMVPTNEELNQFQGDSLVNNSEELIVSDNYSEIPVEYKKQETADSFEEYNQQDTADSYAEQETADSYAEQESADSSATFNKEETADSSAEYNRPKHETADQFEEYNEQETVVNFEDDVIHQIEDQEINESFKELHDGEEYDNNVDEIEIKTIKTNTINKRVSQRVNFINSIKQKELKTSSEVESVPDIVEVSNENSIQTSDEIQQENNEVIYEESDVEEPAPFVCPEHWSNDGPFKVPIGKYMEVEDLEPEDWGDQRPEFYPIVSRQEWGATPPEDANNPEYHLKLPVKYVVMTSTLGSECKTQEECYKVLQEVQRNHKDVEGFADIRFNFMIGGDGKVYEGRGWSRKPPTNEKFGLKVWGRSIEIAYIGNYKEAHPPFVMMVPTWEIIRCGFLLENVKLGYEIKLDVHDSPLRRNKIKRLKQKFKNGEMDV